LRNINSDNLEVQYLTTSETRELTPHDVINWLLKCDIHVILTHMHQSLNWDICEFLDAVDRLSNHFGWPGQANLRCPIFLQDKFRYLNACPDIINESFAFQLKSCF
jgi:hypothetical protein